MPFGSDPATDGGAAPAPAGGFGNDPVVDPTAPDPQDRSVGAYANAAAALPGVWTKNFWNDYRDRVSEAGNALVNDFTIPGTVPEFITKGVANAQGKPFLDTANFLSSPFAGAGDFLFGRPIEALTHGAVSKQTGGNLASMIVPLAGELGAERSLVMAAKDAGQSVPAYQRMRMAQQGATNALAAAAKPIPGKGPVATTVAPLAAAVSPEAARSQAADRLATNATSIDDVRASLAQGGEIVPGSVPTTAQQTGDMGLLSRERGISAQPENVAPFRELAGEQNAARVTALKNIQSGADPNDVAKAIQAQFDETDSGTDAAIAKARGEGDAGLAAVTATGDRAVAAASGAAQERAVAVGGTGTPEGYGTALRTPVVAEETATRRAEGDMWDAVDPEKKLTANTVQTSSGARDIQGELRPTAKPMEGEEAAIFDEAAGLPALAPAQDLIALRARVRAAKDAEIRSGGRTPVYARLQRLLGVIQSNLATTVSQKIADQAPLVANGTISEDDSVAATIQKWVNEHRAARDAETGTGSAASAGAPAETGAVAPPSADGAGLPPAGGPGGAPSAAGLPADAGLAPTFDEAAQARQRVAADATIARARRFGVQPVAAVTRTTGGADQFHLPEARVPEKFFHPGPTGFTDMQTLFGAIGEGAALPIIEDYAASSLRRAAMRDDGMIDPAKFARWRAAHADALRALPPETQARFSDAAEATKAVNEAEQGRAEAITAATKARDDAVAAATGARVEALRQARMGALGKVLGLQDADAVVKTVGQILGGRTATADMRTLAAAVKSDPFAAAGLRQAIVDHLLQSYVGNTEGAASGVNQIKADAFATFFKRNRPALAQVFSNDEVNMMGAVVRDIQRAKRSENAAKLPGGSNTTQDLLAATAGKRPSVLRALVNIMGAGLGALAGGAVGGPIAAAEGGAVGAAFGEVIRAMRAAGIERVDQLEARAMLDPQFAKVLLEDFPRAGLKAAQAKRLVSVIRTSAGRQNRLTPGLVVTGASRGSRQDENRPSP